MFYTIGKKSRLYTGNSTGYAMFDNMEAAFDYAEEMTKRNPVGFDVYEMSTTGLNKLDFERA